MPRSVPTSVPTAHRITVATGLAGAFALSLGLAGPSLAQTTTPPAAPAPMGQAPMAQSAAPMSAQPSAMASAAPAAATDSGNPISQADLQNAVGHDKAAKIEAHITKLHGDLKITSTQEPEWQAFAGTMRQNAVQMDGAYVKRQQSYGSMNAVQDLESYGEVEQINAHNVAQLLPPFRTLYDGFTPAQKKAADAIFIRHIDKAVKKPG